jgi:hypothetical protein
MAPENQKCPQCGKLGVENIAFELKKRHSPSEGLEQIVGRGMGTVLSCLPGRLAFVETEDERFILERHNPLEKREYVRFVAGRKDEDSHVEQGIFQAAALALEWGTITGTDEGAVEAPGRQKIEGSHAQAVGAKDGKNRIDRPRKTALPSGVGLHCFGKCH